MIAYHPYPLCEGLTLQGARAPPLEYELQHETTNVSPMQRETGARIVQSLDTYGFFIMGDGTGVGKGRTLALVVAEWLHRSPDGLAVWVSANSALRAVAYNELQTVGCTHGPDNFTVATYASIARKQGMQLQKLIAWCRRPAVGRILFALDECHTLRNMGQSYEALRKVYRAVGDVATVYASATAMSSVKHMNYLPIGRTLIGEEPFRTPLDFERAVESGGAAFLELVCMHLKTLGLYCARQLSMEGVQVRSVNIELSAEQRRIYDESLENFYELDEETRSTQRTYMLRGMMGFIVSCKVDEALRVADKVLARGETVIFTLVSTGDALTAHRIREEKLRTGDRVAQGPRTSLSMFLEEERDAWWTIPPIDRIVDHYGQDAVAEMTGRKRRFQREEGGWILRTVPSNDVELFQSGKKRVGILSRAGGLGISLHDTGVGRRTVIALELPWSSEDYVQQLGRVHRTTNVTVPSYVLITLSGVYAEQRILQTLMRRTESLGALMHGDRDAWDTSRLRDVSQAAPSKSERRALAMRIAVRRLADKRELSESMIRDVLSADDVIPSRRRAVALQLSDAIDLCDKYEELTTTTRHDENAVRAASCKLIVQLLKQHRVDLAPVVFRWSPETHPLFGPEIGAWVRTLLMAHAHDDARSTFGLLPHELLIHIISTALDEGSEIRKLQFSVPHSKLPQMSTDEMMNLVILTPLESQTALQKLLHDRGWCARAESVRPSALLTYIRQHISGNGIDATIQAVEAREAGRLAVRVSYNVRDVPDPPSDAIFTKHARSGRVGWMQTRSDEVAHGASGMMMLVSPLNAVASTRREFEEQRRAHAGKAHMKCRRLPSVYCVSTSRALHDWANSMHAIVRFVDPQSNQLITGVLYSIGQ